MRIEYFKTEKLGDCYSLKGTLSNIISLTRSDVRLIKKDKKKDILIGAYKILDISEEYYAYLKSAAKNIHRKQAINILKEVHFYNKNILGNTALNLRDETDPRIPKVEKDYLERHPILD